MDLKITAALVALTVLFAAGCAIAPARADAPSGQVVAAPPTASAPLAIATPMLPPSDAQTAFVDGYRAYNDHDTGRAIDRLKFAADNFPALGDYALYYLALAEIGQGDLNSAVGSLRRLTQNYPQSVLFDQAELQLAQTLYKLASYQDASAVASGLIARSPDPSIERAARLTEAKALVALGNSNAAYTQAMELRDRFPHSDADPEARALAYGIIASNPEIAPTHSLEYHRSESELLLREGQLSEAAEQARAGLAMDPTPQVRAELLWLTARAHKPQPEQAKRDISQYLQLAPHGPAAPNALEMLALIYWHDDDYQHARATFSRLAANYPASTLAPAALLRIGRTYEDEHKIDAARSAYRRLIARYPHSDAAADARFRVPWTLYTTHSYASAARGFSEARVHAKESGDRDMCDYWRARALDKSGDVAAARELFARVAASTDSNYYPALASKRVAANPILPASYASEPEFNGIPNVGVGSEFHLQRLQTLRALGLKDLEAGELNALAQRSSSLEVRRFVLAGFANADAWYAAIVVATRMEKSGQVSHAIAERVRYPRAYWDIFQSASIRLALDPYLVLALSRQESLFNPQATSSSNARGLMQLIPSTAKKMAAERGIEIDSTRLYDPATNVDLGTTYLKNLLQMFGGDAFHAVAAYNAGEHAVAKWLAAFHGDDDEWVENIAYKETRDYVKKVIGGRREYLLLYQHGA